MKRDTLITSTVKQLDEARTEYIEAQLKAESGLMGTFRKTGLKSIEKDKGLEYLIKAKNNYYSILDRYRKLMINDFKRSNRRIIQNDIKLLARITIFDEVRRLKEEKEKKLRGQGFKGILRTQLQEWREISPNFKMLMGLVLTSLAVILNFIAAEIFWFQAPLLAWGLIVFFEGAQQKLTSQKAIKEGKNRLAIYESANKKLVRVKNDLAINFAKIHKEFEADIWKIRVFEKNTEYRRYLVAGTAGVLVGSVYLIPYGVKAIVYTSVAAIVGRATWFMLPYGAIREGLADVFHGAPIPEAMAADEIDKDKDLDDKDLDGDEDQIGEESGLTGIGSRASVADPTQIKAIINNDLNDSAIASVNTDKNPKNIFGIATAKAAGTDKHEIFAQAQTTAKGIIAHYNEGEELSDSEMKKLYGALDTQYHYLTDNPQLDDETRITLLKGALGNNGLKGDAKLIENIEQHFNIGDLNWDSKYPAIPDIYFNDMVDGHHTSFLNILESMQKEDADGTLTQEKLENYKGILKMDYDNLKLYSSNENDILSDASKNNIGEIFYKYNKLEENDFDLDVVKEFPENYSPNANPADKSFAYKTDEVLDDKPTDTTDQDTDNENDQDDNKGFGYEVNFAQIDPSEIAPDFMPILYGEEGYNHTEDFVAARVPTIDEYNASIALMDAVYKGERLPLSPEENQRINDLSAKFAHTNGIMVFPESLFPYFKDIPVNLDGGFEYIRTLPLEDKQTWFSVNGDREDVQEHLAKNNLTEESFIAGKPTINEQYPFVKRFPYAADVGKGVFTKEAMARITSSESIANAEKYGNLTPIEAHQEAMRQNGVFKHHKAMDVSSDWTNKVPKPIPTADPNNVIPNMVGDEGSVVDDKMQNKKVALNVTEAQAERLNVNASDKGTQWHPTATTAAEKNALTMSDSSPRPLTEAQKMALHQHHLENLEPEEQVQDNLQNQVIPGTVSTLTTTPATLDLGVDNDVASENAVEKPVVGDEASKKIDSFKQALNNPVPAPVPSQWGWAGPPKGSEKLETKLTDPVTTEPIVEQPIGQDNP